MKSLLNYLKKETKYVKDSLSATLDIYFKNRSKINILKHINKEIIDNNDNMTDKSNNSYNVNVINNEYNNTIKNDLSLPIILDKPFSRYLLKFMHSPRNKENPSININNLLFLTGIEKSGKTWFLRQTLKEFESKSFKKNKNLIVHFDCKTTKNFNSFLFLFEEEIINSLSSKINNFININLNNYHLLFLNLLFFRYERSWIEINISQVIEDILNNESDLYLLNKDSKNIIENLYNEYKTKKYKETPLINNFELIIDNLCEYKKAKNMDNNLLVINNNIDYKIKICLMLIRNILIKRENFDFTRYQNINNKEYSNEINYEILDKKDIDNNTIYLSYNKFHYEEYRTGINCIEYFLDIINYLSGYHEIYLKQQEMGIKINSDFILNKTFNDINSFTITDDELKMDDFIQSVLVLEHVEEIFSYCDAESRPKNYIEHLILRLYNDKGYRDHFPVVFETNNISYFERELYFNLWDHKWRFPTLFYDPKQFHNSLPIILGNMFNNKQTEYIIDLLNNSSTYYYNLFVETLIKEGKNSFESLINLDHNVFHREYAKFRYKFNKLYLNNNLSPYLDTGEIDILILNVINQWSSFIKNNPDKPELNIRKSPVDHIYFSQDITKALIEENIILHHRYNSIVRPYQYLYTKFISNETEQLNRKYFKYNKFKKALKYCYYYISKSFLFKYNCVSIGRKRYLIYYTKPGSEYSGNVYRYGYNIKYDVPMELYKGNINSTYFYNGSFRTDIY